MIPFSPSQQPAVWQFWATGCTEVNSSTIFFFIYHKFHEELGPLWARPSLHRTTQQHRSAVHLDAFSPSASQFMIIFSTVANQTEHPPNGCMHAHMHARTHSQSVKADMLMIQTRIHVPGFLRDGCDLVGKVSIHQWKVYEWNNSCAGSKDSVTTR